MNHLIRQHYLHISLNGTEAEGMALQRQLSDFWQHRLLPAIEPVFDRYAQPDEHLVIGHLEVDAGAVSLAGLEHELAEQVRQAIEQSLRAGLSTEQTNPTKPGVIGAHKTRLQSVEEALIYFLKTGSLPWAFQLPDHKTLEQLIVEIWQTTPISDGQLPVSVPALQAALRSKTARKRLVWHFSPLFLETLLHRISPATYAVVRAVRQGLFNAPVVSDNPADDSFYVEQYIWEAAFALVATGTQPTDAHLLRSAWQAIPDTSPKKKTVASLLSQRWPGVTQNRAGDEQSVSALTGPVSLPPAEADEWIDTGVGLFIDNAGLVLLHPFLPRFFDGLGLLANNEIHQPERALCLLYFLATGQGEVPEYSLQLPKILCNIPLESPVNTQVILTDAETSEAVALLEAVIRHWDVLKNASVDALRSEFLMRPGKLSRRRDGDWQLQLEGRSVDVLLDNLPWGISMIQLPWMEQLLRVEWR